MILTDKCLEAFGVYILKTHKIASWECFENLPKLLQNALIIEFFDSVNITVDVMPILNNPIKWQPNTLCLEKEICTEEIEYFDTRSEATEKAIEKANEIFNN